MGRSGLIAIGIVVLALLWLLVASFRHSVVQVPIPQAEVAYGASYEFPSECGLEAVVCENEKSEIHNLTDVKPSVEEIVRAISILETGGGTNIISGKNNATGIKVQSTYIDFTSIQECLDYTKGLWERRYAGLPLEDALAKYRTGDPNNRDPETLKYIANFWSVYNR